MAWFLGKNNVSNVIDEVKEFLANDLFISKTAYGRGESNVEEKLVSQLSLFD